MRHRKQGKSLGRKPAHRKAMLGNLVTSLIEHERVQTTHTKAKEAQRVIEPLVTRAKTDSVHSRRIAAKVLKDPRAVQKLFGDIGPRFADRPGGYTRVLDIRTRKGDGATVSLLEFIPTAAQEAELQSGGAAEEGDGKGKKKGLLGRKKSDDK